MTETSKTGRKSLSSKINNRLLTLWLELVTGFLWWGVGAVPSHTIRKLFYRLAGMHIGNGSVIHMFSRLYDPRHIRIGVDTIIGEKATLDGRKQLINSEGGLEIGNHVDIASEVMIWTSQHDIHHPDFSTIEQKVIIEDYVFIGPRAIILPGVTIGKGAIVAAGAVVTKSVEPFTVVAGVPAHTISERKNIQPKYILGRARLFQ
jgi:acetyltransferase-like isoleucine patch superfamily enzyme